MDVLESMEGDWDLPAQPGSGRAAWRWTEVGVGGKTGGGGEGALCADPGCPAGVCLVVEELLALVELIVVDFLRLSGSTGEP